MNNIMNFSILISCTSTINIIGLDMHKTLLLEITSGSNDMWTFKIMIDAKIIMYVLVVHGPPMVAHGGAREALYNDLNY